MPPPPMPIMIIQIWIHSYFPVKRLKCSHAVIAHQCDQSCHLSANIEGGVWTHVSYHCCSHRNCPQRLSPARTVRGCWCLARCRAHPRPPPLRPSVNRCVITITPELRRADRNQGPVVDQTPALGEEPRKATEIAEREREREGAEDLVPCVRQTPRRGERARRRSGGYWKAPPADSSLMCRGGGCGLWPAHLACAPD